MSQIERIFRSMPPVTKNLIIINVIVFVAMLVPSLSVTLYKYCALHYFGSDMYNVAQPVTYMFMHGGFMHIFFNMFTLFMFGMTLEYAMGSKRFLLFYMVCGVGAGLIQELVWSFTLPDLVVRLLAAQNGVAGSEISSYLAMHHEIMASNLSIFTTVGASGAIYGILIAFGMLFPNRPLYFMFVPVPIKAKYMVMIWAGLEFLLGFSGANDGIGHFAHLGGMLFGFVITLYWKKKGTIGGDYY